MESLSEVIPANFRHFIRQPQFALPAYTETQYQPEASLPSQVSPEHVHSLATFQMSRIMFRAFQNSLRLANSPGFPFKIPARLLFAPTEITALSSGGVANSCYCFRKALEVGFFFPQLC